jgi:SNF2 family DNA or RNA helicase
MHKTFTYVPLLLLLMMMMMMLQSLSSFRSRHRLLLTGTPLQNNIHELWALLHFVMPSIFDNLVNFDEWFNKPFQSICDTGDPLLDIDETSTIMTIQSLHRVLRPFLLRREKKQVEQLPEKVEKLIRCDMSGMQKKLYEQVRKGVIFDDSRHIRALNAPMVQLRKVCNHPFLFYDELWDASDDDTIIRASGKFVMLDNIIAKMRKMDHKMLLFSQWVRSLDLIERFLNFRGITREHYLRLDGSTKGEERAGLMKQFNAPDSPFCLFLMTTKAGGLGINLQAADTVLLFDLDWNPQNDAQVCLFISSLFFFFPLRDSESIECLITICRGYAFFFSFFFTVGYCSMSSNWTAKTGSCVYHHQQCQI